MAVALNSPSTRGPGETPRWHDHPAISALSAVEGINVATPVLEPFVIPISVATLLGLFLIQRHGTGTVGRIFGPIMIVWFTVLAVLGIGPILGRETVLAAQHPGMVVWREKIISTMARNATPPTRYFHIPPERSLEIGIQIEI